jgi:hypothetical protein
VCALSPPPPPADVTVENTELAPFVPSDPPTGPFAPPPPTVIGKPVAVTEIFVAPSKGDAE